MSDLDNVYKWQMCFKLSPTPQNNVYARHFQNHTFITVEKKVNVKKNRGDLHMEIHT